MRLKALGPVQILETSSGPADSTPSFQYPRCPRQATRSPRRAHPARVLGSGGRWAGWRQRLEREGGSVADHQALRKSDLGSPPLKTPPSQPAGPPAPPHSPPLLQRCPRGSRCAPSSRFPPGAQESPCTAGILVLSQIPTENPQASQKKALGSVSPGVGKGAATKKGETVEGPHPGGALSCGSRE